MERLTKNPKVVIVRGLPGSGKSTLAQEIASNCGYIHFENDMFFETPDGYQYDKALLGEAQAWCFRSARDAFLTGHKIVVSNVFSKIEHMQGFMDLTEDFIVIECTGQFGNKHDVPEETLKNMGASWEPYHDAIRV